MNETESASDRATSHTSLYMTLLGDYIWVFWWEKTSDARVGNESRWINNGNTDFETHPAETRYTLPI